MRVSAKAWSRGPSRGSRGPSRGPSRDGASTYQRWVATPDTAYSSADNAWEADAFRHMEEEEEEEEETTRALGGVVLLGPPSYAVEQHSVAAMERKLEAVTAKLQECIQLEEAHGRWQQVSLVMERVCLAVHQGLICRADFTPDKGNCLSKQCEYK